jgi:hypothetical protein
MCTSFTELYSFKDGTVNARAVWGIEYGMNGVTQEVAFTWFVVVHRSTQNIYHILRIEAFS